MASGFSAMDEPKVWVSCADCVKLTGKSRTFIERCARDKEIRTRVEAGRVLYHVEDLAKFTLTRTDEPTISELCRALGAQHLAGQVVGGEVTPEVAGILRDWGGTNATDGGSLVPLRILDEFVDRMRSFEPLDRCRWYRVPSREFEIPVVNETSRVAGSRFGGCVTKPEPSVKYMP
jgi:hypothetical protein